MFWGFSNILKNRGPNFLNISHLYTSGPSTCNDWVLISWKSLVNFVNISHICLSQWNNISIEGFSYPLSMSMLEFKGLTPLCARAPVTLLCFPNISKPLVQLCEYFTKIHINVIKCIAKVSMSMLWSKLANLFDHVSSTYFCVCVFLISWNPLAQFGLHMVISMRQRL